MDDPQVTCAGCGVTSPPAGMYWMCRIVDDEMMLWWFHRTGCIRGWVDGGDVTLVVRPDPGTVNVYE